MEKASESGPLKCGLFWLYMVCDKRASLLLERCRTKILKGFCGSLVGSKWPRTLSSFSIQMALARSFIKPERQLHLQIHRINAVATSVLTTVCIQKRTE